MNLTGKKVAVATNPEEKLCIVSDNGHSIVYLSPTGSRNSAFSESFYRDIETGYLIVTD